MEYGHFTHLEQNHYQLQAKGKLEKCWLLRSLMYTDITIRLLFKTIEVWFYHVKCYYTGITISEVVMYYGNTLDWELRGLDSGPYYPHNLEEVTYSGYASSFLICKWSYCTKSGFQNKRCLSCFMRWLAKGHHLNPSLRLTGTTTSTSLSLSQSFSVSVTHIPISSKNANTLVKKKKSHCWKRLFTSQTNQGPQHQTLKTVRQVT